VIVDLTLALNYSRLIVVLEGICWQALGREILIPYRLAGSFFLNMDGGSERAR
jgi:hypothetical protein